MLTTLNQMMKVTKGTQFFTVKDIAEESKMFPIETELSLMQLHDEGLVKCYWYKGKMYVVLKKEGGDKADLVEAIVERAESPGNVQNDDLSEELQAYA